MEEVEILKKLVAEQADEIDFMRGVELENESLKKQLKNLQGKYDSKVARYKRIITKYQKAP